MTVRLKYTGSKLPFPVYREYADRTTAVNDLEARHMEWDWEGFKPSRRDSLKYRKGREWRKLEVEDA